MHHMLELMNGLEVDTVRMRQNLDVTQGLIFAEAVTMALGKRIGKQAAHQIMEEAAKQAIAGKKSLRESLSANPEVISRLSSTELDKLFDPLNYLGVANEFIDRTVVASKLERR